MPQDRFFIDKFPLQENESLCLKGEEAHHLLRVMRKKRGERVELVNGKNQLAIAEIQNLTQKEVTLKILILINQTLPKFQIIICQAIPRPQRLDTIVEKATELGMNQLWLFPGQLSEKKVISPSQLQRLHNISIAALKQSGRLDVPQIEIKPDLKDWKSFDLPAYFGQPSGDVPHFSKVFSKKEGLLFFIGPEAGFTEGEKNELIARGAQAVSLHPNILRTDTASLVALSLIHQLII